MLFVAVFSEAVLGRSPHGERGLKLIVAPHSLQVKKVALLTESVD